ncbi:MAG: hypothetical protein KME27_00700 [Lyngbya sp. HA4199-MV5]|jgi:hypothetical protein|nr:hypothetical protein [Lyngbya sp. HA4199-MV5]
MPQQPETTLAVDDHHCNRNYRQRHAIFEEKAGGRRQRAEGGERGVGSREWGQGKQRGRRQRKQRGLKAKKLIADG